MGYDRLVDADIRLTSDGKSRPDLILVAERGNQCVTVIGECKACNERFSGRVAVEASIQLLSYKLNAKPHAADEGLLVVTGSPEMPEWNQVMKSATGSSARESDANICIHSRDLANAPSDQLANLRAWYESNVHLIDGSAIRQVIEESDSRTKLREAVMNFIEK